MIPLLTRACWWIALGIKRVQSSVIQCESLSWNGGVFRHPQVIEDQTDVEHDSAHFPGNAAWCFCFDGGSSIRSTDLEPNTLGLERKN